MVEIIADAGDHGATWDEVCEAINQMYLEAGHDIRVRPGSISPRFREERKHGTIRIKREADGSAVTRCADSGFEQDVYVMRKDDEPIDVVETDIDDFSRREQARQGLPALSTPDTIRKFCTAHPDDDYLEDTMAALAGVIGDRLVGSVPFGVRTSAT